jgi:hypothetical protein
LSILLVYFGCLSELELLTLLLFIIGLPILVVSAFALAIYTAVSLRKETFTAINLEESFEPTEKRSDGASRA